ncbi:hypothetical protein PHAVU_003G181200 [Phaseolus vulgaris]|uniref:Cysteine-rich transmembrane domain-containing protein n=1 Tax=Phaseolus vulgaris TaxID=3885 RepID=V7CAI7_PHAVU|nr:hypothetical protein PHAVU_003G181200g [Phaseolus vulgaris]ESW27187.1 hypothetical protein PHAVU_003G181200g [Phaseolus vulgaris]
MSHGQNQPQVWNSGVADESKDTAPGPYEVPPPPPVITLEDKVEETKFKGDGFWRGCCAGICCYCCLDICF